VVSLQDANTSNPVVLHKDIGQGHVVLIGTDYFTLGTGMDRIVANAVAWARGVSYPVAISPAISGSFSSGVWTGGLTVLQTASQMRFRADNGSGISGDSNPFDVTGTLTLSMAPTAAEGNAPVNATVSVSFAPAGDLTATLSSSDGTAATVPATVTILSGQTSATFPVTIVDDAATDGTQVSTITAQIPSWANATSNISVLDNETLSLALFLPGTVTEGSTATATVAASGTVASALTVTLVSNNTSRLTVPPSVTIPIGSSSVTFNVTGVENALADGSAVVNVAASASGYAGANANATVLDNDLHHFSIAAIGASQTRNVPFNVTITAHDVGNAPLTGYTGTPALSASGTGGTNAISRRMRAASSTAYGPGKSRHLLTIRTSCSPWTTERVTPARATRSTWSVRSFADGGGVCHPCKPATG